MNEFRRDKLSRLYRELTAAAAFWLILSLSSISNFAIASSIKRAQCADLLSQQNDFKTLNMERLYLGDGAKRFKIVSETDGHAPSDFETKSLSSHLTSRMMSATGWLPADVRLVDFGPGSGLKAIAIARDLLSANAKVRSMVAVDISPSMLKVATRNWQVELPEIPAFSIQADFREMSSSELKKDKAPTLLLLFGQTLGNFKKPERVLKEIHAKMGHNDRLWVGVSVFESAKELDRTARMSYSRPEDLDFNLRPLEEMGIPRSAGSYHVEAQASIPAISGKFILNSDVKLKDGQLLPTGFEIQTFFSRRFLLSDLEQLFASAGLVIESQQQDIGSNQVLIWAKRADG